ncbi:glycoside hydrolase family protein [Pontiella agarivorans]|uniref:Glycoside hydrolase family protein n=1 Tax=Pontiella agarivorans TaxID=3038953 RepID=A0ABU5MTU0_9BACT|nr:glycoside hydrolase family protein [Pontiella agarivorans]MDZ8117640.1 glycoside hydrolase family protein [Pontiella agarivorans]
MKRIVLGLLCTGLCLFSVADSVVRERPQEWKNLIRGGQFKDLFLPMPVRDGMTSETWGGENVKPRDITNGIEDPEWSYWCASAHAENGKYHLYTSRWPENEPRGHFGYFDSEIVHAVADDPAGPYIFKDWIGPGHNPELYRNALDEWMIYSTHGRFYSSKSLNGPWKAGTYIFDQRGRYAFKNFVNFSFAERDNRSVIAVSRRGYIWASPKGRDRWYEVSSESVYPKVPGIFEDPVMWRDDIQYHIIVNDWKGRIAYYLRSKDGFHWKTEEGEAYVPGIARYTDGSSLDWYKYERIRFLQDEYGRPYLSFFAVIDTDKHSDLPNDIHNSKSIVIPVQKPRLIEVLNTEPVFASSADIRVKISAESDFDPIKDIDFDSIRFGDSTAVNYGRGAKFQSLEKDGDDLILVFSGKESGLTEENFAGKLLGKTKSGEILYGWSRLPGVVYEVPVLSALAPKFEFTGAGLEAYVEVTNFGTVNSEPSTVKLLKGSELLSEGTVRRLNPFEKAMVRLSVKKALPKGSKGEFTVLLEHKGLPTEKHSQKVQLPMN